MPGVEDNVESVDGVLDAALALSALSCVWGEASGGSLFGMTDREEFGDVVEFEDFVIKLLVIDQLMKEGAVVPPHPTAHKWLEATRGIDPHEVDDLIYDTYAHKRIPEIEQWARDLELDRAQVSLVQRLVWDGGIEIFMLIAASWDGEDDLFDPRTWVDVTPERFPMLESVVYVEPFEDDVRRALEDAGVTLRHV
ncbi:DUF6892 domain-containing protein [Nocardioides alkalitolerans]|uniref:DUF6892 domain-containing protein n=1 Tax=Nocardioides alkalitolerans TaxID=281714 RepID=UPI00069475F6|nr:hypothetical protein [Nocardioides alkalitolerans]